jgi:hypothetical protein
VATSLSRISIKASRSPFTASVSPGAEIWARPLELTTVPSPVVALTVSEGPSRVNASVSLPLYQRSTKI